MHGRLPVSALKREDTVEGAGVNEANVERCVPPGEGAPHYGAVCGDAGEERTLLGHGDTRPTAS